MLSDLRISKYFNLAKSASSMSDFYCQLGCVVVYKGRYVISTGWSSTKSNPIQKEYDKYRFEVNQSCVRSTLHAESMALNKIKNMDINFSKIQIFTYREHKNGTRALSRPCASCMAFIKDLGIKEFYYTVENGWGYEKIGE